MKKDKQLKDQLIANLLLKKKTWDEIKDILQTGNSRISWATNQLQNNSSVIQSAPRDRPPKVNSDVINFVESKTLENPIIGGSSLSKIIASNLGFEISPTTINSIRNQLKFCFQHPRWRPFMTNKYIENRLSFCHNELGGIINYK